MILQGWGTAAAWAAPEAAPAAVSSGILGFLPFLVILVLFYLLLILPQQRRQKRHRAMLESIKKGDRVVAAGGVIGVISQLGKDSVTLQVGDNVRIRVLRDSVTEVRPEDES